MNIIEVNNLCFGYGKRQVLKDLNFSVEEHSFIAVAGPNGSGKTTLINLLCRSLRPRSGSIKIDSKRVKSYGTTDLAQKIAVVRQEFVPVFGFRVEEVVSMARVSHLGTFGFESQQDKQIVARALEMTDTSEFASRTLGELSGGERQRVFIARALAQDTPILLLDEPTSFLDLKHQVGVYDLLKKLQRESDKTVVAVTHDINLASQYCDKALLLGQQGDYSIGAPKDVFKPEQIERVFGVRTFAGTIRRERFVLPIGQFAADADVVQPRDPENPEKQAKQ
jgi:iron complex transport system ATP-binding protein